MAARVEFVHVQVRAGADAPRLIHHPPKAVVPAMLTWLYRVVHPVGAVIKEPSESFTATAMRMSFAAAPAGSAGVRLVAPVVVALDEARCAGAVPPLPGCDHEVPLLEM